jgi:hypothetical protein
VADRGSHSMAKFKRHANTTAHGFAINRLLAAEQIAG